MAKRTAQKRKAGGLTAANKRNPAPLRNATTFGRPDLLILLGLAVMTFGIYAQVIGHQFITLDDDSYIRENPMVNCGVTLAGLAWALTTFHAANWHPLTWIAHMIDSQLFGMNAGGHLLVNALIHVANTLLVFWFLLRTTHARWPSALIAALFALHPLHVESVAWASERKDTLSTFFGLLSLIAYVRYAEERSSSQYAWTSVTLALGLLAKPMLVTWPFVMLLLDYWPLRRFELTSRKEVATKLWLLVREKLPLFALVAASAVITSIAQSHAGAVRTFTDFPIALRLSNALVSYAKYLLLTFWPNDLTVYYSLAPAGIPAWQIIGAAFLLIGITAFCLFQGNIRPYLIVGWLWFLGALVPVIGLVQVGGQAMADRYFYIPSIGLFIAVVFGLADIAKSWRVAASVSAGIAGGVLLVLATLTNAQIHRWSDSFTLFKHALAVAPPDIHIENGLGLAMGGSGRYDEAAAHFEKALQIRPDDYVSLSNMGATRFYQGRLPEAVEYYQAAIRSQPDAPKAHNLLGLTLAKQNRNEAALDEMRRASELAPKDADIRNNLGLALAGLGRIPEAMDQLHEALRLNPNNAEAHSNLGLALLASGKPRESVPEFEAALRLKPELKVAADSLRHAQAQLSSQR
ncbi:MAG TPA: tetratricopeptide repeat protein [Chthoniobacterales bacterium]|nr:tetratricopeptide repeat protein [Chthoniobacterales bacterium]